MSDLWKTKCAMCQKIISCDCFGTSQKAKRGHALCSGPKYPLSCIDDESKFVHLCSKFCEDSLVKREKENMDKKQADKGKIKIALERNGVMFVGYCDPDSRLSTLRELISAMEENEYLPVGAYYTLYR